MKLKDLFKEIEPLLWEGSKEVEITTLSANSKEVVPGTLFLAKRGKTGDGRRFIQEAVLGGASAIVTDLYDPSLTTVTQIIHSDVNKIEPLLAKRFYKDLTKKMSLIGISGTAGKTTVAFIAHHFLTNNDTPCGLIGSIAWMTSKRVVSASLTTPDLLTSMALFDEMKREGCETAVMEVSSIGIEQGRTAGMTFSMGVFTNFSQDHLDYHLTMEVYAEIKSRFFAALPPKAVAIINGDDPMAGAMIRDCSAPLFLYGFGDNNDLVASDLDLSLSGTTFNIHWQSEKVFFHTDLIGRFNVYNILAAASIALLRDIPLMKIAKDLKKFKGIPGRLERVSNDRDLKVFVDYAHKPGALKNVLQTLSALKKRGD